MRLLVGLGNPGKPYVYTRHNVGFLALDALIEQAQATAVSFTGKLALFKGVLEGQTLFFVKPLTMMNLSGEVLPRLLHYYKLSNPDVCVLHDELDVPEQAIRFKRGGGHGGHRGLMSMIQHIGADFLRLRIGIGRPTMGLDAAAYVLQPLVSQHRQQLLLQANHAAEATIYALRHGLPEAMQCFHPLPKP